MMGSSSAIADIVPVDVCVNMMISIAWHTAIKQYVSTICLILDKSLSNFFSPKNVPVYHCCTGHLGTLTWGKVAEYGLHHLYKYSLESAICYPYLQFTENR